LTPTVTSNKNRVDNSHIFSKPDLLKEFLLDKVSTIIYPLDYEKAISLQDKKRVAGTMRTRERETIVVKPDYIHALRPKTREALHSVFLRYASSVYAHLLCGGTCFVA